MFESSLEGVRALYAYRGAARSLVGALKEAGDARTARFLAGEISRRGLLSSSTALLVPLPPSREGRRRRGFDHSHLLVRALAGTTGVPRRRLIGRRGGGEQKRLDREGRMENMKGQLYLRGSPGFTAPGSLPREITLVDDVVTTGATLEAAGELLRAAGVARVNAVVVALD
jgi:ComF family protein